MASVETYRQVTALALTLHRWADRMAGRKGLAEDLVQETYLRSWRGWAGFQEGTNLEAWLFTIMRNIWVDWCRQPGPKMERPAGIPHDWDEPASQPLDHHPDQQTTDHHPEIDVVRVVTEAARAVPPDFLEVLIMLDVEGLTRHEVAERLGIAAGTVSSRAHRARLILRDRLDELMA